MIFRSSEFLSAESGDEVNDTPENYDESAQKTPDDAKILEKAQKVLNQMSLENMKVKSFEFLTLMHQNPKKVQLITSSVVDEALSKPNKTEICVALLEYLKKGGKDAGNTFDAAVTQFIANFYENHFNENMIGGLRTDNDNIKNLNIVKLMCKLYERKVITCSLVLLVIRGLLKADHVSEAACSFVFVIMTSIGSDLAKEEAQQMKKYFDYIQFAVESDKMLTYRSIEYTKLIAYRKNGWKATDNNPPTGNSSMPVQNGSNHHDEPVTITLEFDNLDNEENLYGVVLKLRSILVSEEHVVAFIKILFNYNTIDFSRISTIAGLIQKLAKIRLLSSSGSSIQLIDIVTDLLTEEFTATNEMKDLDRDAEEKLTRLVLITSELYRCNVISEDGLIPWLLHTNLFRLPLPVLTQVSTIISLKHELMNSKTLAAAFQMLETKIGRTTLDKFAEMKSDFSCFEVEMESLRKAMATNPSTS